MRSLGAAGMLAEPPERTRLSAPSGKGASILPLSRHGRGWRAPASRVRAAYPPLTRSGLWPSRRLPPHGRERGRPATLPLKGGGGYDPASPHLLPSPPPMPDLLPPWTLLAPFLAAAVA